MRVLKFGGSSVGQAEAIKKVIGIIQESGKKNKIVVVVSALGGTTDQLIHIGTKAESGDESYKTLLQKLEERHVEAVQQLLPPAGQSGALSMVKKYFNDLEDTLNGVYQLGELSKRIQDRVLSFGELLSSKILSAALNATGINNVWKDSRELIETDSAYGHAQVNMKTSLQVMEIYFSSTDANIFVLPGFIARDEKGITTTLGRGGSDYTASILAASLHAEVLEIWTDVNGIMTADPRLVPHAKQIPSISYAEAMELSHFGAKVLYPPTIHPVRNLNIPLLIKNTFDPGAEGTRVEEISTSNGSIIRGISSINNVALISLEGSGMVGIPGFSKRFFESLANEQINVILITQGSSEHSICAGVEQSLAAKAKLTIDKTFDREIDLKIIDPLIVEEDLSIIALVGDNMKSHPGISGKMFGALGRNGVNVRAIAQGASERNISAVISSADVKKAINTLHEQFFETTYKQVNLFLVGLGNVGQKLINQLSDQQDYLRKHLRLQVKVIGMANSRRMHFDENGIDLGSWKEKLHDGTEMNLETFLNEIITRNLRNSIFADVTASPIVASTYQAILQKSISVVACNKIACSSKFENYIQLKETATDYNASFLFETNVGAGLPVIDTLNNLLRSGDQVNRIEAVLSGTLNYVFNHYNGKEKFADIVKHAQDEGYTEPDPRLDLGGTDVMRKIMILAREAGYKMDLEDVDNHSFMPEACMQGDIPSFYQQMELHEDHFKQLYNDAENEGAKLKFVAQFQNGNASVGLKKIPPEHDFYHLYGKDNVVLFYTNRYTEQPLVIKGAGAGADVTASGVFADIIRASA